LSSLPELYAAWKYPEPTAATMSPPGTAGAPIDVKRIAASGPNAAVVTSSSSSANAWACGPIVAEPLKLRNLISTAREDAGAASAHATSAASAPRARAEDRVISAPS
jgi:hypothetical protein